MIRHEKLDAHDCYFWATQASAELDLLIMKDGKKLGFEFKYTDLRRMTRSMHIALEDLKLDSLVVLYAGEKSYSPQENVLICGLEEYLGS